MFERPGEQIWDVGPNIAQSEHPQSPCLGLDWEAELDLSTNAPPNRVPSRRSEEDLSGLCLRLPDEFRRY